MESHIIYTWNINTKAHSAILDKIELRKFNTLQDGIDYVQKKSTDIKIKSIEERIISEEEFKEEKKLYKAGQTHAFYKPPTVYESFKR